MEVNITIPAGKATATSASTMSAVSTTVSSATMSAIPVKTLKRCLSVPIIRNLTAASGGSGCGTTTCCMTTRAAAAAAAAHRSKLAKEQLLETTKRNRYSSPDCSSPMHVSVGNSSSGKATHIPHSNPSSREVSPAPVLSIFAPRARRYSASYSPLSNAGGATLAVGGGAPLRLTPRVSQLRQEECVDVNSREVNHEREVHSAMQMSQSWEDLTLVAENWSCKSDEFSNPLQVILPAGMASCSSPSPTSNRGGLRLPYGLSPSPTRRTFATRRSMSPIAMRPSQLGQVKRKFELEDSNCSNWNVYSPPPLKKMTTESRGSSPICQSPSSICPSPDSGTYDGRITPKLFISKLCTTNTSSSACSSPMSTQTTVSGGVSAIDSTVVNSQHNISSSSPLPSVATCGTSEPICMSNTIDEGISISDIDEKQNARTRQRMSTDLQDEVTLMDDTKSETSSIGGCSSISTESSFCDNGARSTTNSSFLNKFMLDDGTSATATTTACVTKTFIINKQGFSGPKKFIVNHDNLPNSNSSSSSSTSFSRNSSTENMDCLNNACSTKCGKIRGGAGVKDVPNKLATEHAN